THLILRTREEARIERIRQESHIERLKQQAEVERIARAADQKVAEAAQSQVRASNYVSRINLADQALALGHLKEARKHLSECVPPKGEYDLRGFEFHYLWNLVTSAPPEFAKGMKAPAYCLCMSADGKLVATAGEAGVCVWDYETREQLFDLPTYPVE